SSVEENVYAPAYNKASKKASLMSDLASVDIVLTSEKKMWTRCPVIEVCPNKALSEGHVNQFEFRGHRSVNVNGDTGVVSTDPLYNSDYISRTGMGWFPGYAINLETGERLNIMFSENSWLSADNGRDMLFNPTSRILNQGGIPVFGGQHYVYIMGSKDLSVPTGTDTIRLHFPAYDGGAYLRSHMLLSPAVIYKTRTYATCMYTGIPLSIEGKKWLSNPVTIKIRVAKPYQRFFSNSLPASYYDTAMNRCFPLYSFSTSGIASAQAQHNKGVSDLDKINVVPNPYYAYDDYERSQLDNRVKIVNLPLKCTVTIFNISGTLIRQYVVDKSGIGEQRSSTSGINTDSRTSIDWDLKNFAGIPVSGGVYLIHVKADGLGEKTVKWFGILRPVDLNSF
ncbi:MAG: hypothetical protein Q8867_08920, partial [Bacteroidota bacterium]|nr:hypothetical protein [Bacteroidota bacterium]